MWVSEKICCDEVYFLKSDQTCWRGRRDDVCADLSRHLLQRRELLLVDELELGDEVVEVLVAGVDVRLGADAHDAVEVVHVDVDEHAVQPSQDLLALRLERLGEGDVSRDGKQLKGCKCN